MPRIKSTIDFTSGEMEFMGMVAVMVSTGQTFGSEEQLEELSALTRGELFATNVNYLLGLARHDEEMRAEMPDGIRLHHVLDIVEELPAHALDVFMDELVKAYYEHFA